MGGLATASKCEFHVEERGGLLYRDEKGKEVVTHPKPPDPAQVFLF